MGIDVGSTTVKTVIVEQETNKLLYAKYERHLSDIKQAVTKELKEAHEQFGNIKVTLGVTGSSGLALHEKVHLPFVQEVQAAFLAIKEFYGRRQNHLCHQWRGRTDERELRRGNRSVYRPNGRPS